MIQIEVGHTHLYKGARGRIVAWGDARDCGTALVRFADGVTANGRLTGAVLSVESYVTGAGTRIAPKAWHLRLCDDGGAFRVDSREALDAEHEGRS